MPRTKEVAGVAVDKALLAAIKTAADAERRTLSSFCALLLEDAFRRYKICGGLASLPLSTNPNYAKDVEVIDGRVKRKRGIGQKKRDRIAGGRA